MRCFWKFSRTKGWARKSCWNKSLFELVRMRSVIFPMRAVTALSILLLFGAQIDCEAEEDAILRGIIKDALSGHPTPCTVTVTDSAGVVVVENGSFSPGFRCSGEFLKRLPPGRTRIRVSRGFETEAVSRELQLLPGVETNVKVLLERRVDMRKHGWYAGDSHVHMLHGERTLPVTFDFVALTAQAED